VASELEIVINSDLLRDRMDGVLLLARQYV